MQAKMTAPKNDAVQYGLRFLILPDSRAAARARETARFCVAHRIPSVHLFFNAEEWNRGHVTQAELKILLGMFRRIIPIFRKAGITVNLNPWSTTLHGDNGRHLRTGQNFQRMTLSNGHVPRTVASWACPRWRAYLADVYGRMAALGFDTIWIEDDFRFHNHGRDAWGGDFSAPMLRLFAQRIGRKRVTRQEVLENVLKPGAPHPWRRAWLALWRECSETTAGMLRDAVARANPGARIGLMSSNLANHAAEGRDWAGLFNAIAIHGRAAHRPNFYNYAEHAPTSLIHAYTRLEMQKWLRPAAVTSFPEVENFPFGRFNKSDTATFAQMALAKLLGSEGLLLDLHPMTGNGVEEEKGMGALLDKAYPALDWIARRFPRRLAAQGVGIPFIPDIANRIRLAAGSNFANLVVPMEPPAYLLGSLGVAYHTGISDGANVLWGRHVWASSDKELRDLLKRGLWLDAEAALIMCRRGFGREIGLIRAAWMHRNAAPYSMERFRSPQTGVRRGFLASCNKMPRVLRMQPAAGADIWTEIIDYNGQHVGAGLAVFKNGLGGRVAVSAMDLFGGTGWNYNFQRQQLVQNLVGRLSGRHQPVTVGEAPYALPIDLRDPAGPARYVAVLNAWTDPANPTVTVPGERRIGESWMIRPLERPERVACRVQSAASGLRVTPRRPLPALGLLVLEFRQTAAATKDTRI